MIEAMKFVQIMGPIKDLDRVAEEYISKNDIQLEPVPSELQEEYDMSSFSAYNPYTNEYNKAQRLSKYLDIELHDPKDISYEKAVEIVDAVTEVYTLRSEELHELDIRREEALDYIDKLKNYQDLDFDLKQLETFKYTKCRFGKLPVNSYLQLDKFLKDEPDIVFVEGSKSADYVWGIYFAPESKILKVDEIFSSLHFDVFDMPYKFGDKTFDGKPGTMLDYLNNEITRIDTETKVINDDILSSSGIAKDEMALACKKVITMYYDYDCRRYAAKTAGDFYLFNGWMKESDVSGFAKKVDDDNMVVLSTDVEKKYIKNKPPIDLRNIALLKPFELFTKMYGVPSYHEMDPTFFVALTYTFFFGMMFGDLGQGVVLFLLGLFLYKKYGMQLAGCISIAGCSSMFFGIMYSSFFGFEGIWHPIWISPAHDIMDILISAVICGATVVVITMVFNIINTYNKRDMVDLVVGANGICGLVFYLGVILFAVSKVKALAIPSVVFWIILGIPFVIITFRETIKHHYAKKNPHSEEGGHHEKTSIGIYIMETFIELFEVMLSYFTNTVSFVRVGGFAISHACLMGAIITIAGVTHSESMGFNSPTEWNFILIILGNFIVMCIEGLVVGIQVLRLEYYEMFSRYYEGAGKEFLPYRASLKFK